jgi:hypothetical protein
MSDYAANVGLRLMVDVPTLNALYRHLLTARRRKADNTRMYAYWLAEQEAGRTPKAPGVGQERAVTSSVA